MPIQQILLGLGAVGAVEYAASDNQTNIALSSVFGSDWAADVAKIYTVASGIDVGGTGGTAAITANSNMGGTLEIVVAGTVTGTGGSSGAGGGGDNLNNYVNPHVNTFHWNDSYQGQNGSNGGDGGHAILIESNNVTVKNSGTISGGGGGGAGGGGSAAAWFGNHQKATQGGDGGDGGNGAGWNQSQSNGACGAGNTGWYSGTAGSGGDGGTLGNGGGNCGNGWNYNRNQYSSSYYVGTGGGGGTGGSAGAAVSLASGISYTKAGGGTFNGAS